MNDKRTWPDERFFKKPRQQLSITTLFLLVAIIAAWLTYLRTTDELVTVRGQLAVLRPLTHELIVDDIQQVVAVRRLAALMGESIWDIHIPRGETKALVLDGQAIAQIQAGKHSLELRAIGHPSGEEGTLYLDGRVVSFSARGWLPSPQGKDGGLFELTACHKDERLVLATGIGTGKVAGGTPLIWIE